MRGHRLETDRRRSYAALALALAAAAVALLTAPNATAYCRSTTCSGTCQRDADGCKTDGHALYWTSMCVGFSIQQCGSVNIPFQEVERVMETSFVAWSDLPCLNGNATIAFSRAANTSCNLAEYNLDGPNANNIIFQDYRWSYTGSANTLAKTTVTYDNETGEILDADLEFNHAFNEYTTGDDYVVYDLQSVATHEIGHFIGLDHSPYLSATMNAGYQSGSMDQRTLDQDDIDGICVVYPPERPAVCDTTPKGGFSGECTSSCPAGEEGDEDEGCSLAGQPGRHRGSLSWLWLLVGAALLSRAAPLLGGTRPKPVR